jgi:hypothetical protein
MKLLVIAMSQSIHTARWLSQIAGQGWDVHLYPSIDTGSEHPDIHGVTVHHSFYCGRGDAVKRFGISLHSALLTRFVRKAAALLYPQFRASQLRRIINRIKPDIVHSMEIQHAGYLALEVKKDFEQKFPPWIVTNWGSDLYYFAKMSEHEPRIRAVLASCDYYSCECRRDVHLAEDLGLKSRVLPVFPNSGGFDLEKAAQLKQRGQTSQRRLIMLKGYQGWAGRALVALKALERCAGVLEGYTVAVYLGFSKEVKRAAELFSQSTGIPVEMIPEVPHDEILRMHGQARISIGLSISDAISTSFLEALVMGSFPIQSWTACADEWINDGKTGILVHPEDPEMVEKAIRRALSDDTLVDRAAEENWKTALERLDYLKVKQQAIDLYKIVARERGIQL